MYIPVIDLIEYEDEKGEVCYQVVYLDHNEEERILERKITKDEILDILSSDRTVEGWIKNRLPFLSNT